MKTTVSPMTRNISKPPETRVSSRTLGKSEVDLMNSCWGRWRTGGQTYRDLSDYWQDVHIIQAYMKQSATTSKPSLFRCTACVCAKASLTCFGTDTVHDNSILWVLAVDLYWPPRNPFVLVILRHFCCCALEPIMNSFRTVAGCSVLLLGAIVAGVSAWSVTMFLWVMQV